MTADIHEHTGEFRSDDAQRSRDPLPRGQRPLPLFQAVERPEAPPQPAGCGTLPIDNQARFDLFYIKIVAQSLWLVKLRVGD